MYEVNNLNIFIGGHVVHSYGRLVHQEYVITRGDQLLPPGNATGPGILDCIRTASEIPHFRFFGGEPPQNSGNQIFNGDQMATVQLSRRRNRSTLGGTASKCLVLSSSTSGLWSVSTAMDFPKM